MGAANAKRCLEQTSSAEQDQDLALLRFGHYALKAIWEEDLGLKRKIVYEQKEHWDKVDFDFNSVISHLVFRKVMSPTSILGGFHVQDEYLGAPVQGVPLKAFYSSLDFLKKNKDAIFKWTNRQLDGQFGNERAALIFYDVTNAYFESPLTDAEKGLLNQDFMEVLDEAIRDALSNGELATEAVCDEDGVLRYGRLPQEFLENLAAETMPAHQRMRGPSKEHRTDLPLVSIALVIDKNGMPMDFEVFAGNASEFKTMRAAIEGLKKKYSIKEAVVVADRSLNSASNLSMLKENELGFLIAQKISKFSGKTKEKMLALDEYEPINPDHPTGAKFRTIPGWKRTGSNGQSVTCTLVLTWDPKRKARDEAVLNVWADLVRRRCGKKLTSRRPSWAAIAAVQGDESESIISGIDEAAFEERRKMCGFAAMAYDEAKDDSKKLSGKLELEVTCERRIVLVDEKHDA